MGANSYVREETIPGGETLKTDAAPLCHGIMKSLTILPVRFVVTSASPSRDNVEAKANKSTLLTLVYRLVQRATFPQLSMHGSIIFDSVRLFRE
jgi:hypothetical protein